MASLKKEHTSTTIVLLHDEQQDMMWSTDGCHNAVGCDWKPVACPIEWVLEAHNRKGILSPVALEIAAKAKVPDIMNI